MGREAKLLAAVQGLHEAVLEPDRWGSAIQGVAEAVNSEGGTVEVHDFDRGELLFFESGGLCDEGAQAFADHYRFRCPRMPVLARSEGGDIVYDFFHMTEQDIVGSEFYNDFLRGQGLKYYVAATLFRRGPVAAGASFQRTEAQGHIQGPELETMKLLQPHLRQAVLTVGRLRKLGRQAEDLRHALDRLDVGVVLIDRRARVVFMNAAARVGVTQRWPLAVTNGVLRATMPAERRAVDAVLGAALALANDGRMGGSPAFLCGRRGAGPAVSVTALPLPVGGTFDSLWEDDPQGARVLVLLAEAPSSEARTGLIREVFGLTEAEAALAADLSAGRSLAAHAEARDVTIHTVRTHFARIKAKLGARNQGQVVAILRGLLPPFRSH